MLNVASNSNSKLPAEYRIAATWGSHEGSLLLWVLMLSVWMLAVSVFSRSLPEEMLARILGVMGLVAVGFLIAGEAGNAVWRFPSDSGPKRKKPSWAPPPMPK